MSNSENRLSGITVGLSLSESSDIKSLGFSDVHFKNVVIEFSRYLLASGVTLAYGGDFRQGGFTEVLFDLKTTYKGNANKIVSYLAWPIHAEMGELSADERLKYMESAEFHKSPIPDGVDESIRRDKFLPPIKTNLENMLIWARSLTQMRRDYLARLNDAQILLGGRMDNYSGKYPGLVEEAYEVMRAGKPLYLIGAFGGATKVVIDAVSGARPEALTAKGQYRLWAEFERKTHRYKAAKAKADTEDALFQIQTAEDAIQRAAAELEQAEGAQGKLIASERKKSAEKEKTEAESKLASAAKYDEQARFENYRGFVEYFNQNAPASEARIDYDKLVDFFNEHGIAGLNNHLTDEENQRLFVTPHVTEMIALTLKGLVRIKR